MPDPDIELSAGKLRSTRSPGEKRGKNTGRKRGEIVGSGTKPFVSKMLLTFSLPIGHRKTPLTKCFPSAYMLLYYFLRGFQLCWNS